MRLLHLNLASLLLCACSNTLELALFATPVSVAGDGEEPITVTAKVTRGGITSDTGSVHFTASLGRFEDSRAGTTDALVRGGAATVRLLPPRQGRGRIDLAASVSSDGLEARGAAQVALTPSGGLARSISLTCQRQNVGGLVSGRADDIHVLCTAVAVDASGRPIAKPSVETRAEAGDLSWVDDGQGSLALIYTVKVGAPPPAEVDPLDANGAPQPSCPQGCLIDPNGPACQGEPCWVDPAGRIHNPRDGVATLLVAAPGTRETDALGEPYVDANDSGRYDLGETFVDFNGNGRHDAADGATHDRLVWAEYRIVWSGDADLSRSPHGSQFLVTSRTAAGAAGKLFLNDQNFNALAAASPSGASDTVELAAGACESGGTLTLQQSMLLSRSPGIQFRSDGRLSSPGLRSTYRRETDYSFSAGFAGSFPETCQVSAHVSRSYDPGAPGFARPGALLDETVTGAIAF